jgi:hypothetical protein
MQYRDLLLELQRRKYTYREIRQILQEKCQVEVSLSTLHGFLRTQRKPKSSATRTSTVSEHQKSQNEMAPEHVAIFTLPKKAAPMASPDEVRQRIAMLKQQTTQPKQDKKIFHYDPDQPLHLIPGS